MTARSAEECDALFERCANQGDVDGIVSLYEPEAVLVQQDGTLAVGKDAIRAALAALLSAQGKIRMGVKQVVQTGDTAVVYNDWTMTLPPESGGTEATGKAIEVVRRQADGSWLYLIDDPFARG